MSLRETLPPRRTLNGKFDAYCHVCWRAVYAGWIDTIDPAGKCPHGAVKIHDCQEAMGWARTIGELQKNLAMSDEEHAEARDRQKRQAEAEAAAWMKGGAE